jgi:hypothetical protein
VEPRAVDTNFKRRSKKTKKCPIEPVIDNVAPVDWTFKACEVWQDRFVSHGRIIKRERAGNCLARIKSDRIRKIKKFNDINAPLAGLVKVLAVKSAFKTAASGNPAIANVRSGATDSAILIFGRAVGTTNVVVLDETDQEVFTATVRVTAGDRPARHRQGHPPTDRPEQGVGLQLHAAVHPAG